MLNTVVFYILAGMAVLSAALMVTRRNARHSAVIFTVTLLATAGIFLQLQSRILFATQVLLFAGGIMALFFFVIQLVDSDGTLREMQFARQKWVLLLVAIAAGGEAGVMYWSARKMPLAKLLAMSAFSAGKLPPNTRAVLRTLFSSYLLPLEIAVLLLLVAAAGVLTVTRKRA